MDNFYVPSDALGTRKAGENKNLFPQRPYILVGGGSGHEATKSEKYTRATATGEGGHEENKTVTDGRRG